jgi:hypothetical protein
MNVEVGQWVRDLKGLIGKVDDITTKKEYAWSWTHHGIIDTNDRLEEGHIGYVTTNKKDGKYSVTVGFEDITAVANTPQELIQVGDLYTDKHNRKYECLFIQNGVLYSHYFGLARPCGTVLTNITAIYTPNENGDYIKQWDETND